MSVDRSKRSWGSSIYGIVSLAGEEFSGIDDRALVKALQTLEQQRKAEIIRDDDQDIQGVKFF